MTKLVSAFLFSLAGYYFYHLAIFFIADEEASFYISEEMWVGHSLMLIISLVSALGIWFEKVWAKYLTWMGVLFFWGLFAFLYFSLLFTGQYTQEADLTRASIAMVLCSAIAIFLSIGVSQIGSRKNG